MKAGFAFGLGMLAGAILSWQAGGRFAIARHFSLIAGEHLGRARALWGGAAGSLLLLLAVAGAGLLIMIVS